LPIEAQNSPDVPSKARGSYAITPEFSVSFVQGMNSWPTPMGGFGDQNFAWLRFFDTDSS
jgi:hypothetical protein